MHIKIVQAVIFMLFALEGGVRADERGSASRPITWGTYDTTISDYQTINVWMEYRNASDSEVLLSAKGAMRNAPTLALVSRDVRVELFRCDDINVHLPPKSRYFRFCAGEVGMLPNMKPDSVRLTLLADSFWNVVAPERAIRIVGAGATHLHDFIGVMDSVFKTLPRNPMISVASREGRALVSKPAYSLCEEMRGRLDSVERIEPDPDGLISVARRHLNMQYCQNQSLREISDTYAPNWPWLKNHARCTSKAYISKTQVENACLHEDRDRNLLVKRLAGLTAVLDDSRPPYRFLAGSDTVYIGKTSWINGHAGEVFK